MRVEFFSKFKGRGIKIDRINLILVAKPINFLQYFIMHRCDSPVIKWRQHEPRFIIMKNETNYFSRHDCYYYINIWIFKLYD